MSYSICYKRNYLQMWGLGSPTPLSVLMLSYLLSCIPPSHIQCGNGRRRQVHVAQHSFLWNNYDLPLVSLWCLILLLQVDQPACPAVQTYQLEIWQSLPLLFLRFGTKDAHSFHPLCNAHWTLSVLRVFHCLSTLVHLLWALSLYCQYAFILS